MIPSGSLRIGNWVSLGSRLGKITELLARDAMVLDEEYINDTLESYNRIEGIPLTEEILIKAGFKKESDQPKEFRKNSIFCYKNKDKYTCQFEMEAGDWNHGGTASHDLQCEFLHQLQNAHYVLYQEELDINLISE